MNEVKTSEEKSDGGTDNKTPQINWKMKTAENTHGIKKLRRHSR